MRKVAVPPILLMLVGGVLLTGCDMVQARMELNKGNSYYRNEKYKDALIQFQKGLALDPSLKFAWRSVALSAMTLYRPGVDEPENNQYFSTAIDAFKKYLAAYPQDQKAQEFMISTYMNANKYDEVLNYLKDAVKKNPGDLKSNKAIVTIYLRTQRIKEAYDWIVTHIPKADAEPYYLVSVYCWDKAYRDPSLSPDQRSEFVELGLQSADKALQMQPEYFDAMIYTNLLLREKAKLQTTEAAKQQYFDKAEEWRTKALALREKLKKQTSLAKS
ncbi:MAG TPA: tetratricopeptide repeat protein [Thermoanaerobaculaceae bacterium]|nr:tetratricopeptide repeat protein [Thermoanaerobaculaceae bacterium]